MSRETKLIKNTAIIAIGNMCTKCISFLMLPLYTSILSTAEYGTFDLLSTYVSLITAVLTLQLEQAIFRFLIEHRNDNTKKKEYISTTFYALLVACILVIVFGYPILTFFKYQYSLDLVMWIVIASLNAIVIQVPRGLGYNGIYAIASCLSGSSNVILNFIFVAVFHMGVSGMVFASLISLIASVMYVFISLKLWNCLEQNYIKLNKLKELLSYSLPLIPNSLCWWIVNVSDRILLNIFVGVEANGIYSVACKFPTLFTMITNIFQLSWTESAAENINEKDSKRYFQEVMISTIKFYSSCNIGIIAVLPMVFPFLVKEEFTSAYVYIPILLTGGLFHSISSLYGSIYTALKETKKIAHTTVISAVLNCVINFVLIKEIGIYAAAISTLLSYFVITIIRHFDIQKNVNIQIPLKYIMCESVVYILVFGGYYFGSILMNMIILILLVPYCFIQNKKTILRILNAIKSMLLTKI